MKKLEKILKPKITTLPHNPGVRYARVTPVYRGERYVTKKVNNSVYVLSGDCGETI